MRPHPRELAAQHGLAGVDLAAAGPAPRPRLRLRRVPEYCEGTQVLGVVSVGDPGDSIVRPVQEARLDGGLKPGEDLYVAEFARLVGALVGGSGVPLVRLYLNSSQLVPEYPLNISSFDPCSHLM